MIKKLFESVFVRFLIVGLITLGFMIYAYSIMNPEKEQTELLPIYGPKNADSTDHTIAGFSFVDQEGKNVTEESVKGKIYVADFFFTTCQGICPMMSGQMERVADHFKGEERFHILSHSVKPDEDSVSVLAAYAKEHHADPKQWQFLTGDKKALYEMARKSYLVSLTEGNGGPEDFVHTQFFALVDPDRHIRGFYDGTDSTEVNKLIDDIHVLLDETH
ncbi:MAG TPA: SCO family protein [Bacteroidia bacterium]|nr:SCO family protein [Bacteroidia bacterium]